MNTLIVNKLDSKRLKGRLESARINKTCPAKDAEKLEQELGKAALLDPEKIPSDVVTMNSVVRIHIPSMKSRREFKLVYPEEANVKENKISIFAPIATALLGYRKGDVIKWDVPGGLVDILIEEIIYQPEASGDYAL